METATKEGKSEADGQHGVCAPHPGIIEELGVEIATILSLAGQSQTPEEVTRLHIALRKLLRSMRSLGKSATRLPKETPKLVIFFSLIWINGRDPVCVLGYGIPNIYVKRILCSS